MVMAMVMKATRTVVMRSHEMRKTMRDGMAGGLQTYQVRPAEEELRNTCKDENRVTVHYVHFVKYDDAVSFYDAVSDTIRRRGGDRGIFTEEGVDTVAYFGGNHGSRV